MADRLHIYFTDEEEPLLEQAKRQIDNLSEFFKNILREHLQIPKKVEESSYEPPGPKALFDKKFADFQNEADVRNVFEDSIGAEQALKNLGAILKEAGTDYDKIVKTTCFLADMADFADMNSVYAEFFPGTCPARSAVAVKTLPKNALVEIECIAVR